MFGKSVEFDEKINKNKTIIDEETKNIDNRNIDRFTEKRNPACLEDCISAITNQLKNTWAVREQEIKNLGKRGSVKDDFSRSFIEMEKPKKSFKDLKVEYELLLDKLNKTRNNTEELLEIKAELNIKSLDFYNEMLLKSFNKKTTTELSLKIMHLLENDPKYLDDSIKVLKNQTICPLCYQEISEKHKNNTLELLNELFDKTIEEEKNKIQAEHLELMQVPDFTFYRGKVKDTLIDDCLKSINKYNEMIKIINSFLEEKAIYIYQPHNTLNIDIDGIVKNCYEKFEVLNNNINEYNIDVLNYSANLNKAIEVNKKLSYYDVENSIITYAKLNSEYKKVLKDNEESQKK